jgi:hypothetical protein
MSDTTSYNPRSRSVLTLVGAGLILVAGLIHLVLSPEHFREAPYLGLLFLADFVGAAVAAFGIYQGGRWGWLLGALVAGGAFAAYIVGGTLGLPGVGRGHFLEPVGVLTKMVEALFLLLYAYRFVGFRRWVLASGIAAMFLVTGAATALGLQGTHAGHGQAKGAGFPVRWTATSPAIHQGDQYTLDVTNTGDEAQRVRVRAQIMDHRAHENTVVINGPLELEPGEERKFTATNDYGDANHFQTGIRSEMQDLDLTVTVTDSAGNETARFNQEAFLIREGRGAGGKNKGGKGRDTGVNEGGGSHGAGHGGGHGHGGQGSATAAEQEAADKLVSDTEAGAARFEDLEVARAAGYEQMVGKRGKQPVPSRPAHFLNKEYVEDEKILDPERPEGLMYMKTRDGETKLIGALYVAPRGAGPTVGGELTQWHTHSLLCIGYDETKGVVVSLRRLSGCLEDSSPGSELEMMHVWLFDHPDGPLAPHLKPKDAAAARKTL